MEFIFLNSYVVLEIAVLIQTFYNATIFSVLLYKGFLKDRLFLSSEDINTFFMY